MKNFWENKKVIVTGAAGFIGSHAVKILVAKGAVVTAIVSPKTDQKKIKTVFKSELRKISVLKVDLLNPLECLKNTKGQEIILNFAAMDGGSKFKQEHSAEIFKTNIRIVLNMLDAAVVNNIDRFLLMSSIEVYPKNAKTPITEDVGWDSSDEANGYVWSKRFGEIAAKMYAKEYGLKIAIARPGNVYGPSDLTGIERGRVIPTFIHKTIIGEKIELFDGGKQLKQFIYVDDLVDSLCQLVEKYAVCDPVNIAGKEVISIKNLSELIQKIVSKIQIKAEANSSKQHQIIDTNKVESFFKDFYQTLLPKGLISVVSQNAIV